MLKINPVNFAWPLLLVCAIALLMMFSVIHVPLLDQDEMHYALITIDLLDGIMPYEGVYDHKPVGIFYLYAFFFTLFGEEFLSIRIMSIAMLLGVAANLYFGLLHLGFGRFSRLAAVAFSLSFPIGLDGLAGNTEIMQNFALSLIFHALCLVKDSFDGKNCILLAISGFFVGVGFSFNYLFSFIALFTHLAYLSYLIFFRKCSVKQFLKINSLVFLGFCLAILIVYSQYWIDYLQGGSLLQNYVKGQSEFLGGYRNELNKRYIIDKLFIWVLPFIPLLVAAFVRSETGNDKQAFVKYLAVAIFLAAIIASSMSLRFFNHYWVLATVPLSLFAALAFEKSVNKQMEFWLTYSIAIPLMIYMLSGSEKIINHYRDNAEGLEMRKSLSFIEENIGKGERVVILSASPAYVFLGKLNTDQKYLFPGQQELLGRQGYLDSDQYYLDFLMSDVEFVLAKADFCIDEAPQENARSCTYLNDNFTLTAAFEGYLPVQIYRRVR